MIVLKYIKSKDDVWWYEAPIPRWWHRCFVQTEGRFDDGMTIHRCACGATRTTDGSYTTQWQGRNQRKRK